MNNRRRTAAVSFFYNHKFITCRIDGLRDGTGLGTTFIAEECFDVFNGSVTQSINPTSNKLMVVKE